MQTDQNRAQRYPKIDIHGNKCYHSFMNEVKQSRPISVLMVEDDITFVKISQHHLHRFAGRNFQLNWKESVEEALIELETNPTYDIIITDYHFRASNGLEFCLQLSELNYHIPVIFLTGYRDYKLAVDAMKLGVEDFLWKEELTDSLLPRTIVNVIDRTRRKKQLQAVEKRMTIAENRAQAIRELVVTVCHEFNNPLAAIKISSDLLGRLIATPEGRQHLVDFEQRFKTIENEIKQLRDINFEKIDYSAIQFE